MDNINVVYLRFNPLTVGAVRSAHRTVRHSHPLIFSFQSPHCRGSPFGTPFVRLALTELLGFQSPHCRGSPFGRESAFAYTGGEPLMFQSPHCRGSPFGTAAQRRSKANMGGGVSIPSLSGQSVRRD